VQRFITTGVLRAIRLPPSVAAGRRALGVARIAPRRAPRNQPPRALCRFFGPRRASAFGVGDRADVAQRGFEFDDPRAEFLTSDVESRFVRHRLRKKGRAGF
jgi:hypothetical protein